MFVSSLGFWLKRTHADLIFTVTSIFFCLSAYAQSSAPVDYKNLNLPRLMELALQEGRLNAKVEAPGSAHVDLMKSIKDSPNPTLLVVTEATIDAYDQTFGKTFFNDFQYVSMIFTAPMILLAHKDFQATVLQSALQGKEILRVGVPLPTNIGGMRTSWPKEKACALALNSVNPKGIKIVELEPQALYITLLAPEKVNRKVDVKCMPYSKGTLGALSVLSPSILAVLAPTAIPGLNGILDTTKFGVPPQYNTFVALYGNKALTVSEISRIVDTLGNERSTQLMQGWLEANKDSSDYFPAMTK